MAAGRSRGTTKSPRDHTGAVSEQLQAEHADEVAKRQGELGMLSAAAQAVGATDDEIVDYTGGDGAAAAELANQQLATVRATLVPDEPILPGAEGNAHLRGTTLQPGQSEQRPTDLGGGAMGQTTVTAGTIGSDGYMAVGNESVKTNSTATTGTGYETPGHSPGAADGHEVTRGRVDTAGDTINATPNYGIRGMTDQVEDLGQVVRQQVRVSEGDAPVVIQVNTDLEGFTYGNDIKPIDLLVGRRYRVPAAVAAHLEEKGYVYH